MAIPFTEWPQQRSNMLWPAMVTDLSWRGFGEMAAPVVEQIRPHGTQGYQWMLSAVMPGLPIGPHIDQQPPDWVARVHVPLSTNKQTDFVVGGERHHLKVGWSYLVNTLREHSVTNDGTSPRVHFMFDIRG